MPKPEAAFAGALSILLLSACGSGESAVPANGASAAAENQSSAPPAGDPTQPAAPGAPVNSSEESVPPPDAVSHPNGYLPPAPAEPDTPAANPSAPDSSPPATEDQYIRNGQ
jgi:hypothetical protein